MSAEAELMYQIVAALNQIPGVYCWRRNVGVRGGIRFGMKGQADIEGIVSPHGRRIELEVKIKADVTHDQMEWLERMARYGAVVGVVHSIREATDLVMAHRRRPG